MGIPRGVLALKAAIVLIKERITDIVSLESWQILEGYTGGRSNTPHTTIS